MVKRNAPRRRRNPASPVIALKSENPEPCEQCRLAHRRIRFSVSLSEAETIITALNVGKATELAAYFEAHLTIATRPDSYQYE